MCIRGSTPTGDFVGEETFTYTITDSDGDTSTAAVTINVNNVNALPIAQDDSFGNVSYTHLLHHDTVLHLVCLHMLTKKTA